MFTFTDQELHGLAQKRFTFENWQTFERAFSAHTEFPACYNLVKFETEAEYKLSAPLLMILDLLSRGLDGDTTVLVSAQDFVKSAVSKGGIASIYDFIEAFPVLILG